MKADTYIEIASQTIDRAWRTQRQTINSAAKQITHAIIDKKKIYIFGCSHAGILAEEAFYRTGGLAVINPIFFPAMMLNTRPVTATSKVERVNGIGKLLVEENDVAEGDVLILHSVSGRNNVPIELALEAKKLGAHTISITNLAYSSAVTSRHPSGKRLFEVTDLVIDNCGPVGDAVIELDGLAERTGPTSTVVGTALLNGLIVETIELLLAEGVIPPVFMSANLDGGDAHNRQIFETYGNQILYM